MRHTQTLPAGCTWPRLALKLLGDYDLESTAAEPTVQSTTT